METNPINNDEALERSVRQAFLMVAEGRPIRKIVDELNSRGMLGPRGRGWTVATLWRHLRDPVYAGRRTEGGRRALRLEGAVVSEPLFEEASSRLSLARRR